MTKPLDNKRIRVVCFSPYPEEGPSVRHRITAYRELWARSGVSLTLWPFMTRRFFGIRRQFGRLRTAEKLAQFAFCTLRLLVRLPLAVRYDWVIIHRELFPLGGAVLERVLKRFNGNIAFDFDDAIWHPPSNEVNQRKFLWSDRRVADTLSLSQVAVPGNEYLADYARQYAARVQIIPTSYDDLGGRQAGSNVKPVVVWIGNLGNAFYLRELLPVLEELSAGRAFTLRLIGGEDIETIRSERVDIEYCRWSASRERAWLCESDIGIMPLVSKGYEQGKCAFKVVQYFSAGLPVVASPVGMNRDVIVEGENGFLAEGRAGWHSALERLLSDASLRVRMGERGRQTYLERFTREENARLWQELLRNSSNQPVLEVPR